MIEIIIIIISFDTFTFRAKKNVVKIRDKTVTRISIEIKINLKSQKKEIAGHETEESRK